MFWNTTTFISDQSDLTFTEKTQNKYSTFAKMIISEKIMIDEFYDFQKQEIKWLEQNKIVNIDENGIISLNMEKTFILKQLYENEVFCCLYYPDLIDVLNEMEQNKDIRYEATLFSEPEQKYLNFMLNKSEYSNGYDLRNKYSHGTYPLDMETQEIDYIELLKIMVLIMIKINEEFCLHDNLNRINIPFNEY